MATKVAAVLIVLVGALGAGGYYNYQRNAHLDEELEQRQYATLDREQVQQLLDAYRADLESVQRRAARASDGSDQMQGHKAADFEGRVKSFDRFQQENRQWKTLRGEAWERQATIEALEHELRIRDAGLDQEWNRIRRRVLHF